VSTLDEQFAALRLALGEADRHLTAIEAQRAAWTGSLARGEASGRSRLTETLVREARRRHADGFSVKQICRALGCEENYSAVHAAVIGKNGVRTWSHLT
jgi:hypothetical protein